MALIHLFRRCNQRCVFCSYPAEAGPGGKAELKAWLKEISEMPPGLAQISGGEPLLADFEDLIKVLAFCARTGRRAELQTNGIAMAALAPERLKTLVKALNSAGGYFNINFPADNPALDFKITRTEGSFAGRTKAVKKLLALGAKVRLTHVVCSLNYKNAAKFAAFAAGTFKGLSWLQFSFIKGIGRARGPKFIPKYSAAAPYLIKALDLCGRKALKCEVDHIPPCFLGRHYARNVDLIKMLKGRKGPHLEEKKKVPVCKGCEFFMLCPGPRKDYIAVHGSLK
ncbi:MAG: radical SAM protein [Elusimicrobia bacterium]|nr:radical SAM protein [Elusimicrobiota bacterium]